MEIVVVKVRIDLIVAASKKINLSVSKSVMRRYTLQKKSKTPIWTYGNIKQDH